MSGIGTSNDHDISAADGITDDFTFTFFAYDTDVVKVYSILDDVLTPITTGITITINSDYNGGNVHFDTPPAALVGDILRRREEPYTQLQQFSDLTGRFRERAYEQGLNKLEMQIQQVNSKASRALSYTEAAGVTNPVIGTPVDGQLLAFSGAEGKIVGTVLGSISNLSTVFTSLTSGDFLNYNGTNWINRKHLSAKGTPIASAATVDLGAADSDFIDLTGTATITSLGSTTTRNHVWVNCTGAMTFTHNGTSLIMPGAANRTAAVGDKYEFVRISGSNWACVGYALANGASISLPPMAADTVKVNATSGVAVPTDLPLSASQLLGKGSSGNISAITLGSGLSMIGSSINAGTVSNSVSASGTAIDFTLSGNVTEISVQFSGISTNGSSPISLQIGPSGGVETSGYAQLGHSVGGSGGYNAGSTAMFTLQGNATSSAQSYSGVIDLKLVNSGTNLWVLRGMLGDHATFTYYSTGSKSISGVLSKLRVTTMNGSDSFDAGSLNIIYR